jgi:hypothetical protein
MAAGSLIFVEFNSRELALFNDLVDNPAWAMFCLGER